MNVPFIQSCLHDATLLKPALVIVNDKLFLLWTHNNRFDCAGKYLSFFVFYIVKCHWYHSLTWTNMLLSFKFLCNFFPPPSFYSLAVTFTYLSVRHTACLPLSGFVVFKISLCFTLITFPRSLWYALFVHFASFYYIFSVLQSAVTAQTTRQCTLTTAKLVPSAPSTPSSPAQTSSSSSSSSPASSCPTLRPVR